MYFQKDMKRLLAFSSVEHMGLISLGIGFGGLLGIYGAILQIINHAIVKPLMFFASGTVSQKYEMKDMSKIKGIIRSMPVTGILFLIGGLALVGMPPFNIFLSEFMILSSGFKERTVCCNITSNFVSGCYICSLFEASDKNDFWKSISRNEKGRHG